MKTYRRTATLVGLAYLFSNVTFILGAIVMVESVLGSPDYISHPGGDERRVVDRQNLYDF